jgi:parallel beta-helix repeat protein
VQVYNDGGGVNDNVVRGNWIYDNARSGARGNGIILSSGARNVAINNVVWGNNGGIRADYASVDAQILNNTTFGNADFGIRVGDGSRTIVRNNIAYQNGLSLGGSSTTASNNLTVDPMFVNASGGDFHLRSGSPAIDAGTAIASVTTDADQVPRPQGSQTDIGAYEFRSSAALAPAAPTNVRIIR